MGGGHQSRFVDFAQFIFDAERTSHFGIMLNLPYCFWASRPSKKMRLDESFHMRYTMLQNTLLVTILKRFTETHICAPKACKKQWEHMYFAKQYHARLEFCVKISCAARCFFIFIMRGCSLVSCCQQLSSNYN